MTRNDTPKPSDCPSGYNLQFIRDAERTIENLNNHLNKNNMKNKLELLASMKDVFKVMAADEKNRELEGFLLDAVSSLRCIEYSPTRYQEVIEKRENTKSENV